MDSLTLFDKPKNPILFDAMRVRLASPEKSALGLMEKLRNLEQSITVPLTGAGWVVLCQNFWSG